MMGKDETVRHGVRRTPVLASRQALARWQGNRLMLAALRSMGILFASALLAGAADAGCSEEDLKAAVTSMIEEGWNRGNVEVLSSSIAETVDFHYAGSPRALSREEMGNIVLRWRDAFPDLHMTIEELIAEGDFVAARLTLSGTHERSWLGAAPTGKNVTMALMMFFRFEEGTLVELWESDDQLGFRRQLGIQQ